MLEIFDDYIKKNVTRYRLYKKLPEWYAINKWVLIFFFAFPMVMDLLFSTFSLLSIFKAIIILVIVAIWVDLKYRFVKHVLVDQDRVFKAWKYNSYISLVWGLVITCLAMPSSNHENLNGNFALNLLIIFIVGMLFTFLFTSQEVGRIKLYLAKHKK